MADAERLIEFADAPSADDYVARLAAAGLRVDGVEALAGLVRQVRGRLVGADVLAKLGQLECMALTSNAPSGWPAAPLRRFRQADSGMH